MGGWQAIEVTLGAAERSLGATPPKAKAQRRLAGHRFRCGIAFQGRSQARRRLHRRCIDRSAEVAGLCVGASDVRRTDAPKRGR